MPLTSDDRHLWAQLLALRPHLDDGHDPVCAGISDFLTRNDRLRTCDACRRFLIDVWSEDRRKRPVH